MRAQFLTLLGARVIEAALQAAVIIVLARQVSMVEFGFVGALIGVCTAAFAVAAWGLPTYLPLVRARGQDGEVRAGLRLSAIGLLAVGAVVSAGALLGLPDLPWLAAVPLALALEAWVECALAVLIADGGRLRVAASVVVRKLLLLGGFVALLALGVTGVGAYATAYLVASGVGAAEALARIRPRVDRDAPVPSAARLYRTLTPYAVASVTKQARTLDVALVGAATGAASAGLYSAAQRVMNPLNALSSSAVAVLLPHAARSPLPQAKRLGTRIAAGAVLLWCLPGTAAVLLAEPLVVLLFGPQYAPAAPAFAWALAALPFVAVATPLGSILQAHGRARYVAVNSTVFAVVLLSGVLVGAVSWGATGASAGVAVAFALRVVSLLVKLRLARPPDQVAPRPAGGTGLGPHGVRTIPHLAPTAPPGQDRAPQVAQRDGHRGTARGRLVRRTPTTRTRSHL